MGTLKAAQSFNVSCFSLQRSARNLEFQVIEVEQIKLWRKAVFGKTL